MNIYSRLFTILLFLFAFQPAICQHNKLKIKSIKIVLEEKNLKFHPGDELNLGIIAIDDAGAEHKTKGFLHGDLKWSLFQLTIEGGTFESGKLKLTKEHGKYRNFNGFVTASLIDQPSIADSLAIPISFDQTYFADYSGAIRSNPHHHHENGPNGYNLDLSVTLEKNKVTNLDMVIVRIKCVDDPKLNSSFAIDPQNGKLTISAKGADGGKGVPGSWGGSGSGNGGNGGNGFNGGNGGSITVTIDPAVEKMYQKLIHFEVEAGHGGAAGHGGNPGAKVGEKGKDGLPGKAGQNGKVEIRIAETIEENQK
jgi:hypothetical protein